jgi:DNA-binding protein HU-beta
VNKSQLIDAVAVSADISKADAGRAIESAMAAISASLKNGEMVTLVGFGSFYVARREARTGRNPRTGAAIEIEAASVPKFRPGKDLREALK